MKQVNSPGNLSLPQVPDSSIHSPEEVTHLPQLDTVRPIQEFPFEEDEQTYQKQSRYIQN